MYIIKLSSSGSLQWTRTLGGTGDDKAQSIMQTTDAGFVVAGYTNSFGAGNYDMYIVKLNNSGTLQWSRTLGGSGDDQAQSITKTNDGGFIVAGYTESFGAGVKDFYIVKFDANGNTCGNTITPSTISGTIGTLVTPTTIVTTQNPTVTSPTPTSNSGGTLTTICFVGIQPISNEIPTSYMLSQNYPNPFNPTTKIQFAIPPLKGVRGMNTKLMIYDILGREVATLVNQQLKPGSYEVEWDGSNYPSGVYFYKLSTESFTNTKRMVLIK